MDYPTEGTVADVTAWVDGDPGRAQHAIDVEQARPRPRKGVLDAARATLEERQKREATFQHPDGRVRTVTVGSPAFARYDKFPQWEQV